MCENLVAALAHRIGKHSVCGYPLHYAYVIVLLAGLGGFFAAPGSTFAVGFFTTDFMDSLGMSRTALSFCWTLALLLTALFMPLSGRAVDKFGPRWVLFGCTIIFSLDNFLMAYVQNAAGVLVGFLFARIGLTMGHLCVENAMNQWFVRLRGKAFSAMGAIASISLVYPSVQLALRELLGWRAVWTVQGVFVLVSFSVISFFLLNRPEQYGLLPDAQTNHASGDYSMVEMVVISAPAGDGDDGDDAKDRYDDEEYEDEDEEEQKNEMQRDAELTHGMIDLQPQELPLRSPDIPLEPREFEAAPESEEDEEMPVEANLFEEIHWKWQDALKTGMFWSVASSSVASCLMWAGFNFHFIEILQDRRLVGAEISTLYPATSVAGILMTMCCGAVFDKLKVKSYGLILGNCAMAVAIGFLLLMQVYPSVLLVLLYGVSFGAMDALLSLGSLTIFASVFGRVDIGTIDAVGGGIGTVAIGVGPLLFGYVREEFGSFDPVLYFLLLLVALSSCAIFISGNPTPPPLHRRLQIPITPLLSSSPKNQSFSSEQQP